MGVAGKLPLLLATRGAMVRLRPLYGLLAIRHPQGTRDNNDVLGYSKKVYLEMKKNSEPSSMK